MSHRPLPALKKCPQIISPENSIISIKEGTSGKISCLAHSTWPDFNIIYWLTNKTFIEDVYPDGRVMEEPDIQTDNRTYCTVEKSLVFSHTQQADYSREFTCVIKDPSGTAFKHFTLKDPKSENQTTHSQSRHSPKEQRKHKDASK
ncbi:interleukin-18-binding protein isoform 2-T2 [Discoglossus pictus]